MCIKEKKQYTFVLNRFFVVRLIVIYYFCGYYLKKLSLLKFASTMRASAALGKATQGLFALVGTSLAGKSRDEAPGKQLMGELQKPRQRACGDGS
jgi:hypothetical protein